MKDLQRLMGEEKQVNLNILLFLGGWWEHRDNMPKHED
jgi:hypothetical protein